MYRYLILIGCCFFLRTYAQETHTVSGYIKDASSGEALIGASIFLEEEGKGAATNVYGYYSFTVNSGVYHVKISYVMYGGLKSCPPIGRQG